MGILLICVLFSMVCTGLSLLCNHCSQNGNTSCMGVLKNCSQDQHCVSTLKQTTYTGGLKIHTFERGCSAVDRCNTSGSMSGLLIIHYHSVCCSTNFCKPTMPELPNVTKRSNHFRCPVCLTHEQECFASKLKNCTGDEMFCASYKMNKSGGKKNTWN